MKRVGILLLLLIGLTACGNKYVFPTPFVESPTTSELLVCMNRTTPMACAEIAWIK